MDTNRGGSRTAARSKLELFVITVNSWKPITVFTKSSTMDVAAVLEPPLISIRKGYKSNNFWIIKQATTFLAMLMFAAVFA